MCVCVCSEFKYFFFLKYSFAKKYTNTVPPQTGAIG